MRPSRAGPPVRRTLATSLPSEAYAGREAQWLVAARVLDDREAAVACQGNEAVREARGVVAMVDAISASQRIFGEAILSAASWSFSVASVPLRSGA